MEIRYGFFILIGVLISILLTALLIYRSVGKQKYDTGIKAANLEFLQKDSLYKRKIVEYKILDVLLWISIVGVIISACFVCARPYIYKQTQSEKYNRDIILCLDISTSVNDLNLKLTKELQDTVRNLQGERVGIVMFNTSPVLLSPLTDDHTYTNKQLENIHHAIKTTDSKVATFSDDWMYCYDFLFSGTLVGNEERGSSLIGDGLMGAVFNFPKYDKKRTKIIIFATDNDPYGTPFVTLPEAAQYCKRNNIVVFGIGTKSMDKSDMDEMEAAMIETGGKFYLEENALTFKNIVADIEEQSADLVKGKTVIKEIENPLPGYRALCIFLGLSILFSILLLRINAPWVLRQLVAVILTICLYFMYVSPALLHTYGDEVNLRSNSDLNVLFVIDGTISMLAQDYNGSEERMTGVRSDCEQIIDELEGARFGIISFDNNARVLAPFSDNVEHTKNIIYSIYPLDDMYARGTNMNVTKDVIVKMLSENPDGNNKKTIVFFVSDGEITSDDALESYSDIAPYVNGGAVLGYGTSQGGPMFVQGVYDEEPVQIMDKSDWPYVEAISQIDEENLGHIAVDMGIDYINMNNKSGFSALLNKYKGDINVTYEADDTSSQNDDKQAEVYRFENNWWMLAAVVGLLYVCEALIGIKKKR